MVYFFFSFTKFWPFISKLWPFSHNFNFLSRSLNQEVFDLSLHPPPPLGFAPPLSDGGVQALPVAAAACGAAGVVVGLVLVVVVVLLLDGGGGGGGEQLLGGVELSSHPFRAAQTGSWPRPGPGLNADLRNRDRKLFLSLRTDKIL